MSTFNLPLAPAINPAHLQQLATVAVRVGLNLQPGQQLILSTPIEALPLARLIIAEAYRAGASVVTTFYRDDASLLLRYQHAPDASFDQSADWLFTGMGTALDQGAARLVIIGEDPFLLKDQNPANVARLNKANGLASKPVRVPTMSNHSNWSLVSYPTQAWAQTMFPHDAPDAAIGKLADAIFKISRVTGADPLADWHHHNTQLHARRDWMNAHNFDALHFKGPGTDLTVGLARGHAWCGGSSELARGGHPFNANIPTEEIFTTPDASRVEGTARSTKPLAHAGNVIDGINVRFEGGRVVEAHAGKGEESFRQLLATDDGACRLGEVALVPHASPISQSGLLFYETLFDENAACHIALGQCYSKCFVEDLDQDAVTARGGNNSLIHVDWMIGSDAVDVDGLRGTERTPVLRSGEWVSKL